MRADAVPDLDDPALLERLVRLADHVAAHLLGLRDIDFARQLVARPELAGEDLLEQLAHDVLVELAPGHPVIQSPPGDGVNASDCAANTEY